jgi:glycosyltransferase involved in cell wall biosynthesis
MSKVLIHSIAFSPDGVSTAYLYNDIALKFKDRGHQVIVLTTTPHYNIVEEEIQRQPLKKKLLGLFFTSDYYGIKVYHVPQKKYKSSLLRIIGFIYWHIASFLLGLFEKKVDLILSPSPPLTLGFINIVLGKIKKAKVIYNVQEIYPDLLISEGGLRSRLIISQLKWLEKFVYNYSDQVTTIDKIFYNTIINRFKNKSKLKIIPNFVDTDLYKPLTINGFNPEYFPKSDSLKLMYAGNIGLAQDWEQLIDLAKALINENIEYFIIGEGVKKDYLEEEIRVNNLTKIHLIPYQSRELMPIINAYSDVHFIFMSSNTDGHGFPSKVYTIMACAKPLIICSGSNSPIVNFLKNKECALLVDEKDLKRKTDVIAHFLKTISKEGLSEMGYKGLEHIRHNYSKEAVTSKYLELAESIL